MCTGLLVSEQSVGLVGRYSRASDLRLNGREFDPRPPHYRSVGTVIDYRVTYHLCM